MVLKTEKEQRLLDASKTFDTGLSNKDLSSWDKILAEEVVLHKDGITLGGDLHGLGSVKGYFQSYIDRYNYEHTPITGAVDEKANVAFTFHVDQGVVPKQDAGHKPTDTLGIFHLQFNMEERVKDIYFLRQLSHDEAKRKLKTVPEVNPISTKKALELRGSHHQSEERAQKHDHAAMLYNHIWATGDVSHADTIFSKDVEIYNVIYGSEKHGVDTFKNMVTGIFKDYEVKENRSTVAVTAGDKAFIFWRITGAFGGDWTQNYGLSLLVFNHHEKIKEVLTFMTPFPSQRRGLMKHEE